MRENNPPAGRSLDGLRLALLGPGRVGLSFAHWATALGAEVVAVAGRRLDGVVATGLTPLVADVDRAWRPISELASEDADVLLITVSDPAIQEVAETLAGRRQAPVALHASGINDRRILAPLASPATAVGSLHPLRAFATVSTHLGDAAGLWFAVDGDPAAQAMAERLARAFGGQGFPISGDQRVLYHLAASLAAGGVTTVLAMVEELIAEAELPAELFDAYLQLTHSALQPLNGGCRPVGKAVTGPAARGDEVTLRCQLAVLDSEAPRLAPSIRRLAAETRRQMGRLREASAAVGDRQLNPMNARPTKRTKKE